jgi:hypothetical protein
LELFGDAWAELWAGDCARAPAAAPRINKTPTIWQEMPRKIQTFYAMSGQLVKRRTVGSRSGCNKRAAPGRVANLAHQDTVASLFLGSQ